MSTTVSYRTVRKRVASLRPSPENEQLYRPVDPNDPEIVDLAASIEREGLHEPLVVTADRYIVSGHRRMAALQVAGQKQAPCRVLDVKRVDLTRDQFIAMLRDHNRQRNKSAAEAIRESLVDVDPDRAAGNLRRRRRQSLERYIENGAATFNLDGNKKRAKISSQKADHVKFVKQVVFKDRREYWPLSVRAIHYALLNYQFLRNIPQNKPYINDELSYGATIDLLVRLRLDGVIPWAAISDETRPVKLYQAYPDVRGFIKQESERFLDGYWRDLLQTQPNYVECLVEKNTVKSMADKVCQRYQVPSCSARGFNSIDSLYEIAQRFHVSGKQRLKLVMLADYDPEGERLTNNAGITLRDEFGVEDVQIFKVGVTREQIERYSLPPDNLAKDTSKHLTWFLSRTGGNRNTYELEALQPSDMQRELDECIQSVLDMDLFDLEVAREEEEATELERVRQLAHRTLMGLI